MKELILNDTIKYRTLNTYTRSKLNKIIEETKRDQLVKEHYDKLREKMSEIVSKYIVDPELKDLWDKYPRIFKSTTRLEIDSRFFGVFSETHYDGPDDGYDFSVSTKLDVDGIRVPADIKGWRYTYLLTEDDVKKIPEDDKCKINDIIYEIVSGEYECKKAQYISPGNPKISCGMTYQKLFNIDKNLYEKAVLDNFGQSYLIYGEDTTPNKDDAIEKRKTSKLTNMDINEEVLNNLKNQINL